ncbi:MAG: hypothetical protein NVV74_12375 [Magnetospirillum sp.]|nr:hypothetical protein [Magnetospirillum sp.]
MDLDASVSDMMTAAFRLSWPAPPPPRPARQRVRRLFGRMVRLCRRQALEGWPVALSAPEPR